MNNLSIECFIQACATTPFIKSFTCVQQDGGVTVSFRLSLLLAASLDSQNLSTIGQPVYFQIVRAVGNASTTNTLVADLLVFLSKSIFKAKMISRSDVSEEIHLSLARDAFQSQIGTGVFKDFEMAINNK